MVFFVGQSFHNLSVGSYLSYFGILKEKERFKESTFFN